MRGLCPESIGFLESSFCRRPAVLDGKLWLQFGCNPIICSKVIGPKVFLKSMHRDAHFAQQSWLPSLSGCWRQSGCCYAKILAPNSNCWRQSELRLMHVIKDTGSRRSMTWDHPGWMTFKACRLATALSRALHPGLYTETVTSRSHLSRHQKTWEKTATLLWRH